ncbi:unnamed protein product [Withania somnifera]
MDSHVLSLFNSSSTFKLWLGATVVVVIWSFYTFEQNSLIERRHAEESEIIPIVGGAVGPESFAFDPHGDGPYAGVSDGRIIKWLPSEMRWLDFALTSPDRYVFLYSSIHGFWHIFSHSNLYNDF